MTTQIRDIDNTKIGIVDPDGRIAVYVSYVALICPDNDPMCAEHGHIAQSRAREAHNAASAQAANTPLGAW